MDHLSASLINTHHPHLFGTNGIGWILSPHTAILCAYPFDSGTQGLANGGCHRGNWCVGGRWRPWCAFEAHELKEMLRVQDARGAQIDATGGSIFNEVIVSDTYWEQHLPDVIEGVMFTVGDAQLARRAEAIHRAFVARFARNATPLLSFDGQHFEDVSPAQKSR